MSTQPQKGYWVAFGEVTDPEGYKAYMTANAIPFAKYGARFVVRGGRSEPLEGQPGPRAVVLEFPSYDAALACYHSPEYAAAIALREGKAVLHIMVVEGYLGPQPGA